MMVYASPPPAITVPAPPIVADGRRLLAWMPGEVRCAGTPVPAAPMRRPLTAIVWGGTVLTQVSYRFAIDATGRPLSIRRAAGRESGSLTSDIAPSLAATRFATRGAHADCIVSYAPRLTAFGDTPVEDLISYTMTPLSGPLPEPGWARITGGGDCADEPRPEPLLAAFPDYRALPATPGVKDWTLIAYRIDARGHTHDPRSIAGTGNGALDAAAVTAMRASRYAGGTPRHGCRQPYWRAPAVLAAPPAPAEEAYRPAGATCPSRHGWSSDPRLTFPEAYARRSIEGWAIVVYDVAPWGEIGNARVVVAQPTEEFGTAALSVIHSARRAATTGLVGCVDRVLFRMPSTATGGTMPPPS